MSVNALGAPLVVIVLVAASAWFGREVMNGVNRMYQPAVQAWMDKHNHALHHHYHHHSAVEEPACHKDDKGGAECRDSGPPLTRERTCAEEMQQRVRILTRTKGLTGPDPGGKYKAILKEEFVANMMAIQEKCQKQQQQQQSLKCNSNLSPFSHIFIQDIHQCWCPVTTTNLVQTQCYYFGKESHVIS